MQNKIYTHLWIEQPKDIRDRLIEVFNIPRTGVPEVRDTTLISDGVTNTDLIAITEDGMIHYVGSRAPFMRLWELSVAKAKSEVRPTTQIGPSLSFIPAQPQTTIAVVPEHLEVVKEILNSTSEQILIPAKTLTTNKSKKNEQNKEDSKEVKTATSQSLQGAVNGTDGIPEQGNSSEGNSSSDLS